jgi:LemA protein
MIYNIRIQTVPTNIVASIFGFKEKELFEAPAAEREAPKVAF